MANSGSAPGRALGSVSGHPPAAQVAPLRLTMLRLHRRLRKNSNAGLTPSQLSALTTLERHGEMPIGRLAEREQITKSSVTRLVVKLETMGLVQRGLDAKDSRSWRVDLTDRGRELLAASSARADAYLARQIAALTAGDQQRLLAAVPVLERLLDVKA